MHKTSKYHFYRNSFLLCSSLNVHEFQEHPPLSLHPLLRLFLLLFSLPLFFLLLFLFLFHMSVLVFVVQVYSWLTMLRSWEFNSLFTTRGTGYRELNCRGVLICKGQSQSIFFRLGLIYSYSWWAWAHFYLSPTSFKAGKGILLGGCFVPAPHLPRILKQLPLVCCITPD